VIPEMAGSAWTDYIFFGGQRIAKQTGSSITTATFIHADHLSVRVTTDTAGAKIGEQGHFPFGENWYSASATTKFRFTSYERDSESLNDYAIFRTHISRRGRFNRPDPIAGTISDPQSLNRYVYVLNDPVNLVDPLGLWPFGIIFTTGSREEVGRERPPNRVNNVRIEGAFCHFGDLVFPEVYPFDDDIPPDDPLTNLR
jgi:RHS repeat-associated protein